MRRAVVRSVEPEEPDIIREAVALLDAPVNQFVGAVNPEMINAPLWLAKAKTMWVANELGRSKDAARAGRLSRTAPNSLKTRIRDGMIGNTMPAALGILLTRRQPRAECNG